MEELFSWKLPNPCMIYQACKPSLEQQMTPDSEKACLSVADWGRFFSTPPGRVLMSPTWESGPRLTVEPQEFMNSGSALWVITVCLDDSSKLVLALAGVV